MLRYKLTAYYEDKATGTHVAQTEVVIAENDRDAIHAAKVATVGDAVDGHIATIKILERAPVEPGVVFRGEPYIPFRWPMAKVPPRASGPHAAP
jgi:hypothetical protein